ncbi:hypothetical protein AN189_16060 [Loktanella sp. 3ANDIMAR09]|uniref:hypothetical protein n=1 Tax=Loktanella sp. 3ANDIMAR09 TaxID=1225657 RepID=UPI0007080CC3|nr:hypothetical protein [Loktanella sp. 3ANDIMAR09]KQI67276.1 hypothetical protein AN189_16060 [Loktanella sp. 3ANDIMAR09]
MIQRSTVLGAIVLLAGCEAGTMTSAPGGSEPAFREFLVIGSSMSFEQCRAAGGLIIRDANSPMTACDPSVKRNPVPRTVIDDPTAETDMNAVREMQDLATAN